MTPKSASPPPRLSLTQVQDWVGPVAYRRGQWYHRQGRITHPRYLGHELRALCRGQAREPYRVQARLGPRGVLAASCTCPAGRDGRCKHVAALLLLWVADPEVFAPTLPVAQRLRTWSREALIALITAWVERYPDLEAWIPLFEPPASSPPTTSPDMDKDTDC